MKNLILLLLISIFSFACLGQINAVKESNEYYEKGNARYLEKDYKLAIELYSLSIEKMPTSDAYYNRALTYFKLQDSCNYCKDFYFASIYGHKKSGEIYKKRCLVSDTIYETGKSIKEEFPGYDHTIVSFEVCSKDSSITYFNSANIPVRSIYEKLPEYPGGDQSRLEFIRDNLKYPLPARQSGIQGFVFITFIVEKNGEVSNVKLLRGIGGGCNEEAIRVVRMMPKWIPGTRKGIPVRVQFNLPLKFTLQ